MKPENQVTASFQNLDFINFDKFVMDTKRLNLTMDSFRVEDYHYVTFELTGDYDNIKLFNSTLY